MRRWLAPAILVSIALGASPASPASPAAHPKLYASALARLEGPRGLAASPSLAEAVRVAAELVGVDPEARHPVTAAPPAIGSLPPTLARTVAELADAAHIAGTMAGASLRLEPAAVARLQARLLGALDGGLDDPAALRRLPGADEVIDRPLLYAGALHLAATIDRLLPRLVAAAPPQREETTAGCEVADQPPVLCIGGSGANIYQTDYALLIDLGGDDVHANSAGGAYPLGNLLAASVTIDLAGNDTYATDLPTRSGSFVAQGSGQIGGIGMLVDVAGADTYAVTAPPAAGAAYGQGSGVAGAGVLADLGGNDSYRVVNAGPQSEEYVEAHGNATLGGLGVLLDAAGNDAYAEESRTTGTIDAAGVAQAGRARTDSFGYAALGAAAVVADGGGTDSITIRGVAGPLASNAPGVTQGAQTQAVAVSVLGGAAAVAFGVGDTAWEVTAESEAPRAGGATVFGFAVSGLGSWSGVHDAGGNDTYRVLASSRGVATASIDEGCDCFGVRATASSTSGAAVNALAYGAVGGFSVLHDQAGGDRYLAIAEATAVATGRDDRIDPPPAPPEEQIAGAQAVAEAGDATIRAEGMALSGTSLLLDAAGDDTYDATAVSDADATATAADPDTPTAAAAVSAIPRSSAQAAATGGYAELRDLGGADSYRSTGTSTATADPPTEVITNEGLASVQGSVELGTAHLLDLSGADTFSAVPPDPACAGTRGQGAWLDCGTGAGTGLNA